MGLEKRKASEKVHVTFSIPRETNELLHAIVEKRELSAFVVKALVKALEEEQNALKKAYAAANRDPDRKEVIDGWSAIDKEAWDE